MDLSQIPLPVVHEHYKHHLYQVKGVAVAVSQDELSRSWPHVVREQTAHYSEDPKLRFHVYSQIGNEQGLHGFGLYYKPQNQGELPVDFPWEPMVYYYALHPSPLDQPNVPRACLRPLEGWRPEGWNTPKDLGDGLVVPRFMPLVNLDEFLGRYPTAENRHREWFGKTRQIPTHQTPSPYAEFERRCGRCGKWVKMEEI